MRIRGMPRMMRIRMGLSLTPVRLHPTHSMIVMIAGHPRGPQLFKCCKLHPLSRHSVRIRQSPCRHTPGLTSSMRLRNHGSTQDWTWFEHYNDTQWPKAHVMLPTGLVHLAINPDLTRQAYSSDGFRHYDKPKVEDSTLGVWPATKD